MLDMTFGTNGVAIVDLSTGTPAGNSFVADGTWGLSLYADDDLLVVGSMAAQGRTDSDFVAARFTPDGAPRTTFATNGVFSLDINNQNASPRTATILSDGSAVVSGYMNEAGVVRPVVYKLTPGGTLDGTFGVGGVYSEILLGLVTEVYGVALQGTSFVTVGYGRNSTAESLDWVSLRLTEAGVLDTTYGVGGLARIDAAGFNDNARAMAVLPGGRVLLVGGGRTSASEADAMLALLQQDGTPDPDFAGTSTSGVRLYDLGGPGDFFWGAALSPDNQRVAVVGLRGAAAPGNDDAVVLMLPTD
jgi:uncharacterized delta-60 repeat protein